MRPARIKGVGIFLFKKLPSNLESRGFAVSFVGISKKIPGRF